jgi:hypothetical protein
VRYSVGEMIDTMMIKTNPEWFLPRFT